MFSFKKYCVNSWPLSGIEPSASQTPFAVCDGWGMREAEEPLARAAEGRRNRTDSPAPTNQGDRRDVAPDSVGGRRSIFDDRPSLVHLVSTPQRRHWDCPDTFLFKLGFLGFDPGYVVGRVDVGGI